MPKTPAKARSRPSNKAHSDDRYPVTPDGHYFVVRDRLWRCTNPSLSTAERSELQKRLMNARRRMKKETPAEEREQAKHEVQFAKEALGERGPVWWTDGGAICDRRMVYNTGYRNWWETLQAENSRTKPVTSTEDTKTASAGAAGT